MPEQIEQRELEIPWHHDVFSEFAAILVEQFDDDEQFERIQRVKGDGSGMDMTVSVPVPAGALGHFTRVLAQSDVDDTPDDTDAFSVTSVNVSVDEPSKVTIEVYE